MAQTCNCCGCLIADGTTSITSGSGQADPFKIDIIDPMFSEQRYAVRRQRTTAQSIPTGTSTAVDFTTAAPGSFDRGAFFVAPSTFVIPTSGVYIFGANVSFADNAVGTREIQIVKNGITVLTGNESNSNAGAVHYVFASSSAPLYATETLTVMVKQTSGGPLDITFAGEQSPVFWAIYVGRFV